ncbi:DUF1758 domain-containing protein [Nephila pilipes]|uniref:DUF1758 domain-containing protein n=1 Tax=Nephila pilipes TaxID=299642 RepID=A0A8X6P3H4_NEPPI|nr:DUF1758 domain-containing protein [Nephila pilipes]
MIQGKEELFSLLLEIKEGKTILLIVNIGHKAITLKEKQNFGPLTLSEHFGPSDPEIRQSHLKLESYLKPNHGCFSCSKPKTRNLKGQLTKLLRVITDEETMDMPLLEAQLEIQKKIPDKFEVIKDYYKSASDEEYLTILTIEASLSEIDQEIQHLEHESAKDLCHFLDCLNKNLRSLKVLEFETYKLSNVLFLNIILEKLDRESRKQYELTLENNEVVDFDGFLNWLERSQILNSINSNAVVKLN